MRFGLLLLSVIVIGAFIFWRDLSSVVLGKESTAAVKKDNKMAPQASPGLSITNRWDLPAELKEVSGIAYLDEDRFACIQDEDGIIFIYNRAANKVEKKIEFAGPGDYEGITVKGNTAYVVRADGRLYKVDMNAGKSSVKEFKTNLTVEHNVEGVVFDGKNNRLLLAIKDEEPGNKDYKGIYAFDLANEKLNDEPVVKIDLNDPLLATGEKKKKKKAIMPSAIGIHPLTQELYITDGPKSKLAILQSSGKILKVLELGKEFAQPEGISFSPAGDVFISNEGTSKPGNIIELKIEPGR